MLIFSFKRNIYLEVEQVDYLRGMFKALGYNEWHHYNNDEYSKIYVRRDNHCLNMYNKE